MDGQDISINDALRAQFAQIESGTAPAAPKTVLETVQQAPAAQQSPQNEPPTAPQSPHVPADERMQKVIAQAQQVRAEREAFKREQAQRDADLRELAELRELKARAKDDPVAWAEAGGYKPDEFAGTLIEKGAVTPEKRKIWEQQKEINDLKQWRTQTEQDRAAQQQQQQYNQVMNEMKTFAEHAGDEFDLIKRSGNYNMVLQKINQHYQDTEAMNPGQGELLPYAQAFEMAEQELFDKVYAPVLESPKIKSRYGAVQQVAAPPSAPQQAPAARPSGTITPKLRGMSAPPAQLSEEQALEAAGRLLFKQFNPGGR